MIEKQLRMYSSRDSRTARSNKRLLTILFIELLAATITAGEAFQLDSGSLPNGSSHKKEVASGEVGKEFCPPNYPYLKVRYLPRVERYFYPENSSYYQNLSLKELIHDSVIAKVYTALTVDVVLHRYVHTDDLKLSGGPRVDQELCLNQMKQLDNRAHVLKQEKLDSKDIELNRLLDTFGQIPVGVTNGYSSSLGLYDECLRMEVSFDEGRSAMRYCTASIKLKGWPEDEELDKLAVLKLAVCLPKSCDSLDYKNKFQLVQQLAEINARQLDIGVWNLTYLYCLPDEESDLRTWWKFPGTIVFGCLVTSWMAVLVFATIKHHKLTSSEEKNKISNIANSASRKHKTVGGSGLISKLQLDKPDSQEKLAGHGVYGALSICKNFERLISTGHANPHKSKTRDASGKSAEQQRLESTTNRSLPIIVNLDVLHGIKVFCMIYIIIGHGLLSNNAMMGNWVEFALRSWSYPIILSAPAFAVNTFFTVTGILTTYLLFKNQSPRQISSLATPKNWFFFVLNRYLRLMPLCAVVVGYAKYVAVYTASGPLWDYGTGPESFRRGCREESWLWTLLLAANMRTNPYGCVPPGWYLSNAIQFAVLTPIFVACLAKKEVVGKWLIKLCFVASIAISAFAQYSTAAPDLRPIVQAMPHAMKSTLLYTLDMYFQPQYRIGPYLVGLLLGLALHKYEKKKLEWLAKQVDQENIDEARTTGEVSTGDDSEPNWSSNFRRFFPIVSFTICGFFAFVAPFFESRAKVSKDTARIIVALLIPTFNSLYASLIGLYMLLAATGHGYRRVNRFLAHPVWRPLSRLSMGALVINMEVTGYIAGISTQMRHFDGLFQFMINIFTVFVTYSAATVLYVLFESPIKGMIDLALAPKKPAKLVSEG